MKSGIKNGAETTLNFSSNLIGNYNNETNFLHKLLLSNKQVSKTHKAKILKKLICLKRYSQ